MNKLIRLTIIFFYVFNLVGCDNIREEIFSKAPEGITFGPPIVVTLPEASRFTEKRKFIDVNCDGVDDMLEVRDTEWIGQDYETTVFPGFKNEQGLLQFSNGNRYTTSLPLEKSWYSATTKIDSADVNGDGCGDLVFSEYTEGVLGERYDIKVAINQGNGKDFKFAQELVNQSIPLSESVLRVIRYFANRNFIFQDSVGLSLN